MSDPRLSRPDFFAASLQYVRTAIEALPAELAAVGRTTLPSLVERPGRVVTTGIGASEAPARMLSALLARGGMCAEFVPISAFMHGGIGGDLVVIFSQGLSPNGRLCLESCRGFSRRWLVTSAHEQALGVPKRRALDAFIGEGGEIVPMPAFPEPNTLVRFVGPTVAAAMALRVAGALLFDARLLQLSQRAGEAYRTAARHEVLEDAAPSIITVGVSAEHAHAHRWKLLEALLVGDPPVWEVLQFAHGPLQTIHDQKRTLIVLERGMGSPLTFRLADTLDPRRHRVLHFDSQREDELSFFEHAAALDSLIMRTLELRPRDLFDWPARDGDGPLYGLGERFPEGA